MTRSTAPRIRRTRERRFHPCPQCQTWPGPPHGDLPPRSDSAVSLVNIHEPAEQQLLPQPVNKRCCRRERSHLGLRLPHPAVLALWERSGSPDQIRDKRTGQGKHLRRPCSASPPRSRCALRDAPRRNRLRDPADGRGHLTSGSVRRTTRSVSTSKPSTGCPRSLSGSISTGLPKCRPTSRRKPQKASSRLCPRNSRRSTSRSSSSSAENRRIAGTPATGQTRRLGHRHPQDGPTRPPREAPEAPSRLRSTDTPSPSQRQDRGTTASSPPRRLGHAHPAATPSSPDRRSSSRRPTADRPCRHGACPLEPTRPGFLGAPPGRGVPAERLRLVHSPSDHRAPAAPCGAPSGVPTTLSGRAAGPCRSPPPGWRTVRSAGVIRRTRCGGGGLPGQWFLHWRAQQVPFGVGELTTTRGCGAVS